MISAILLDLPLLTACTDESIEDLGAYEEQAYVAFAEYRDQLLRVNEDLGRNPVVAGYFLRFPVTSNLYDNLNLFWAEIPYSQFYRLRTIIMAMLSQRGQLPDLVAWLNDIEIEHYYQLQEPSDEDSEFFPQALPAQLCNAWTETLGTCAFECGLTDPRVSPEPILGVCVVSDRMLPSNVYLSRTPCLSPSSDPKEGIASVLAQPDPWDWEVMVREMLWDERRLPFGPIGFCPPDTWRPGQRPRRYQNCYVDRIGGLWEWKGGRATGGNFDGHWDVQLRDSSVRRRWVSWIEECSGREIGTHPDSISHINVEPDGRITDLTFEWCE